MLILTEEKKWLDILDTVSQEPLLDSHYVEHLLSTDNVELFIRIYTSDTLSAWCEKNIEKALGLPNVRDAWVADIDSFVAHVTRAFNTLPDNAKIKILNNEELLDSSLPDNVAAQLACNIDILDTHRWEALPTEWIGAPGSALRATAIARGWTPNALPVQLNQCLYYRVSPAEHIHYPYSTLALGYKWRGGPCAQTLDATYMAPQDAAFALAIVEALYEEGTLKKQKAKPFLAAAKKISKNIRIAMVQLVRSYHALDALPSLMESLANNNLPLDTHFSTPSTESYDLNTVFNHSHS